MKLENGLEKCSCKREKCERHGRCTECMEHHAKNPKHPPYCKRINSKNTFAQINHEPPV